MQPLTAEGPHLHTPDSNSSIIRYVQLHCTLRIIFKDFKVWQCNSNENMKNNQTNNSRQNNNFAHGPGGYSRFQVTGIFEWGKDQNPKKSLGLQTNPQKIPGPKFNPRKKSNAKFLSHKNFQKALNDITQKIETLVSNSPKKLNQATQKITCQNFPTQKIPKSKLSNPQKSFDHPCYLKSGESPLGTCVTLFCLFAPLCMTWNCQLLSFKEDIQ